MRRREFIKLIGGAAAAWPLEIRAQQPAVHVGFLHTRTPKVSAQIAAFTKALVQSGFVDGQNITIEYRFADGQYDRLPRMAGELVHRNVAVLVAAGGEPSLLAAKAATTTIPIVFAIGGDPVKAGLVASYNRPGGNLTGINILTDTLEGKRLGLMHQLFPNATTIGFLWNPRYAAAQRQLRDVQEAAKDIGINVRVLPASSEQEIEAAFGLIAQEKILGLVIGVDPFLDTVRDKNIAHATRQRLPTLFQFREHAEAGGLMSYGVDIADAYRQVGIYVARVLKGEKPGDLPVLQPTKFEFVINLRTAKAFGLAIPAGLLSIVDDVVE
jgi:putative tryptophan/tyrosine transport system substrate-binding protein